MFQGFRWLTMDMKPGDSLVFHFSGGQKFVYACVIRVCLWLGQGREARAWLVCHFSGEAECRARACWHAPARPWLHIASCVCGEATRQEANSTQTNRDHTH